MFDFFSKLFGREKSSNIAKERLQLVLIHDRNDISPETLEHIRVDMIKTLKKYLEIDEKGIEMELERKNRSVALVANIPLKTMNRPLRGQKKK
ncbi:cell division topological specificity factor MinE [Synergistaceae bacterium OttesenSCG-928-D05]|nr:cell division topological specificity factor MinE [Synergistaceae bacterium OttesenSCG-928-D05]